MARTKKSETKHRIETYEHRDKARLNNPPVGLVTPDTDPEAGQKGTYTYDPHLDPQLVWAGKAEHISLRVATVSLHVHERIDPRTIIEAVLCQSDPEAPVQISLFQTPEENLPLRQAIEFYRHAHGWSNRLVAGDSLLVMNSLIEKEGMAGKVQMIYIDPPYGIKYGSNFQPFVNKRDVKDGRDEDLTTEPEQIRAFRDTWELGIHSYLTYLRDRLLVSRELLTESGSVFVQISDENVHHVRELMDEVFGTANFIAMISFVKASAQTSFLLSSASDYLIMYGKDKSKTKYRALYHPKEIGQSGATNYTNIESPNGKTWRRMTAVERTSPNTIPTGWEVFSCDNLMGTRPPNPGDLGPYIFQGVEWNRDRTRCWKTDKSGLDNLAAASRLIVVGNGIYYKRYLDDFPVYPMTTSWSDTASSFMADKVYVVQTTAKAIERCMLMTTDPGDLVFDPTCGSGTTAYVAEQWGRRWITCDTSRVALTLARARLMTAVFDYYELAHPEEGVGSGFKYKTVPHVTLKSIANNEPPVQETLYDQPFVDRKRTRVSGPFTVEAVPAPAVKSVEELLEGMPPSADASIARSGETLRQSEWRDELLRAGIRGKAGQYIRFARLEPMPACRWLHADGETRPSVEGADSVRETGPAYAPQRIAVSFGPEHAPLEQRQVAQAIEEAQTLVPRPKLIVFAAFQFDPEAAKDIRAMHLTQPASIHSICSHGGLSAHDDGTGAAACHRASLPGIPVCAALAGGLCLPAMWRQERLADEAGAVAVSRMSGTGIGDGRDCFSRQPHSLDDLVPRHVVCR
jgi:adenine-specific DNA-methyltransferase